MERIERERAAARDALQAAEAAMKSGSGDARAFAKAKRARGEALEALERLDWAEQAERERQDAQARQAKADKLREVQAAAAEAHGRAEAAGARTGEAAAALVEVVALLRAAQEAVNLAVSHEVFAVREGLLPRPTVEARVRVDRDAALTILRAGRELCMLSGMSRQAAEQQADQRRL